jgi:thiamine pyrophosphokinase
MEFAGMNKPQAIIFLNGDRSDLSLVRRYIDADTLLIGCDGGTQHILELGYTPDVVIGDFDSLPMPKKSDDKTRYIRHPTEKDVTDSELALNYAARRGCRDIILTGLLGTRVDHLLGNIFLLAKRRFAKLNITIIEGRQAMYLIRDQARIEGKKGDTISFMPIKGTARASSRGLKYELHQHRLSLQGNTGISNVLIHAQAEVTMKNGVLLCIHEHR